MKHLTTKSTDSDIPHSISHQLTYVKKLDSLVDVNPAAITNLSGTVKDILLQSHDHFQQVTKDILWINALQNYNELFTVVGQIGFLLLQTIRQIDILFNAVQSMLQGKLPLTFINFSTLQNILRNVSLHLPAGYELVKGTQTQDLHSYYDLVTMTVVGNIHSVKLVIINVQSAANLRTVRLSAYHSLVKVKVSEFTFSWRSSVRAE
jgi:hypothetical protein